MASINGFRLALFEQNSMTSTVNRPIQEPFAANINVPIDGVLSPERQVSVMTTRTDGEPEVDRAVYELNILRTVREKLRCKEVWVVGAKRYCNPDDDLPQDFESRRQEYYQDLVLLIQ